MIISKEDVAWAAGLFEGEGTIYGNKKPTRRNHKMALMVSSTDKDVVDRFQSIVGQGRVHGPYQFGGRKKPLYQWVSGKFETIQFLVAVFWPWLGERRKAQAVAVLSHHKALPWEKPRRHYTPWGRSQ